MPSLLLLSISSFTAGPQVSINRSPPPEPSPARNWLLSFLLRDCLHAVPGCVSARWWPVADEFQGSQGGGRRVAVIWDRGAFGGGDMSYFACKSQDDVP